MNRQEKTELFNSILARHSNLVYKVCRGYAADDDHLKDLYQEVLANVWEGLESFGNRCRLSTWLYRVAINTCITDFRHSGRHTTGRVSIDEINFDMPDIPDDRLRKIKLMYSLISMLDRADRALVMMWLDGQSYEEISAVTGITRNNVASRLHRLRQRLAAANPENPNSHPSKP